MPKYNKEPLATRAARAKCLELIEGGMDPRSAASAALAWDRDRQQAARDARNLKPSIGFVPWKAKAARDGVAVADRERVSRTAEVKRHQVKVARANAEADAVKMHMALCYAPFQPGKCSLHGLAISQVPYGWSSGTGSIDGYRTPTDPRADELLEADQPRKGRVRNPAAQLVPRGEEHGEDVAHAQAQAASKNRPVLKRKPKP
jgi:hypothetical protein